MADLDSFSAVVANKNCNETELSPDGHWLAVTRILSEPQHGQIWRDTDLYSRLVVWSQDNEELESFVEWEDSSIRIVRMTWSPDSRFLVLACTAANGIKPWAFPTLIYDTKNGTLHTTTPLGTVVSKDITFGPPHTIHLSTGQQGAPQPVALDLDRHLDDLPVLAKLAAVPGT